MTGTEVNRWSLAASLWNGFRNLFPTRKTKTAVAGLVGLGVLTTFMELMAAQLFSTMITQIGDQPASESLLILVAFVVAFAGVKGVQYFQSVYRLTVFDRSFRRAPLPPGGSEAWRWPMAIELVGVLGMLARLFVIIVTVARTQWAFGVVLALCSVVALVIVSRTGRKQYLIHHEFEVAKRDGRPPSASERIGTRIRAGERAGLVATVPILAFVAALGVGAVEGRIAPQSALLLFIAGRMAANMYGYLASSTMRYIRSEVYVEVFADRGGKKTAPSTPTSDSDVSAVLVEAGVLGEPPAQAVARLIDTGVFVGDAEAVGRVVRQNGYGPDPSLVGSESPKRSTRLRATTPNQVWCLYTARALGSQSEAPLFIHVVVDIFSRALLSAEVRSEPDGEAVDQLLLATSHTENVVLSKVTVVTSRWLCDAGPTVHDLLKSLGVLRTLRWGPASSDIAAARSRRPPFPTRFDDREACEIWLEHFVVWYNTDFYHAAVGYLHPADVHAGLSERIAERRLSVLRSCADDRTRDNVSLPKSWWPPSEAFIEVGGITTVSHVPIESGGSADDYELEGP